MYITSCYSFHTHVSKLISGKISNTCTKPVLHWHTTKLWLKGKYNHSRGCAGVWDSNEYSGLCSDLRPVVKLENWP